MYIYTIDKDGYIIGAKDVGNEYTMNPNDIKGKPPFPNNHHHLTGLERPKTQEQINNTRIQELKELLPNKREIVDIMTPQELETYRAEQQEFKTLLGI